jgi:hypothetical protein
MPVPRNPRRKNGLVRLACPVCRSEFMRTQYDVDTGRAVCCSNRCKVVNRDIKRLGVAVRAVA